MGKKCGESARGLGPCGVTGVGIFSADSFSFFGQSACEEDRYVVRDLLERRIRAISRERDGSLSRSKTSAAGLRWVSSPTTAEVLISGAESIVRPRRFSDAAFVITSSCQERSLTVFMGF
jgi:hypothetical protein